MSIPTVEIFGLEDWTFVLLVLLESDLSDHDDLDDEEKKSYQVYNKTIT